MAFGTPSPPVNAGFQQIVSPAAITDVETLAKISRAPEGSAPSRDELPVVRPIAMIFAGQRLGAQSEVAVCHIMSWAT